MNIKNTTTPCYYTFYLYGQWGYSSITLDDLALLLCSTALHIREKQFFWGGVAFIITPPPLENEKNNVLQELCLYDRWSEEEELNKDYQFFVHISSYVHCKFDCSQTWNSTYTVYKTTKSTTIKLHCLTINTRSCITFLMYCHLNCCNL